MYLKTFETFFRGGGELKLLDILHLIKYEMTFILFIILKKLLIYFSK